MLAEIHSISDEITVRKALKWRGVRTKNGMLTNSQLLYEKLERFIYQSLDQQVSHKQKPKHLQKCILNLCSIKNRLNETPWSVPYKLSKGEYNIYLSDLNFYLMVSGILLKSYSVFKGFIPEDQFPALTAMLPVFSSHAKRVKQVLSFIPISKWIYTISFYQENNKYIKAIRELEHHLQKPNDNKELQVLFGKLLRIFSVPLSTLFEENHKTLIIKDINKRLKSFKTFPKVLHMSHWSLVRAVFSTILIYGDGTTGKLIPVYGKLIDQLLTGCFFNATSEIHYFKKQHKRVKSFDRSMFNINPLFEIHLFDLLNYLKGMINDSESLPVQNTFITWTHNPKAFVKMIHGAIDNGYITLKGNTDIKPIIEFLCHFVQVKKQNNSGILTMSSLLTYFKKANTDDL